MKRNKARSRPGAIPKLSLAKAAARIQEFERGSLTERLAGLEALFGNADRKRSAYDAVVAETSGANPNVCYEVGYAHAANTPTILI